MPRRFEKKYTYKYEKADTSVKIITPIQFNKFKSDYVEASDEQSNSKFIEYDDIRYDIKYNHIYYANDTNEPFIVVNRYFLKGAENYNPESLKLKIQFIPTCATKQISYWNFIYGDYINDPYYPVLFNGRCAIGNIKYKGIYDKEYKIWWEIMRRCYDPSHRLFHVFGALGAVPAFPNWNTYEFFHRYFEQAYDNTFLLLDANDPMMYHFAWDLNREHRAHMAKFPVEEIQGCKPIPQWMAYVPFMERADISYTRPGRPPACAPSPNLIRHVEDTSPRVKLYTLVDQDNKIHNTIWDQFIT